MYQRNIKKRNHANFDRGAFTLVEMLVAVALVVLMMTLFATVFQSAAETMSLQKGIAENDQRSRTLNTIIRNDLQNRTFRKLDPWDNSTNETNTDSAKREGYFYISENSLDDQTDDVLQFTVRLSVDDQRLFGRALALPLSGPTLTDINQPEGDDGQIEYVTGTDTLLQNNQGASRTAEISYFVRNGNLYRRVLLVREQFSSVGTWPSQFNDTTVYPTTNNFWTDFDYSAHYEGTGIRLHRFGVETGTQAVWIDNTATDSLGQPIYRFGHYLATGNPLEYVNDGTNDIFIGRYTHQETSDPNFLYPGAIPDWDADTNPDHPMDYTNGLLNISSNGIVTYNDGSSDIEFNGDRISEDILLSHVHEFDVKVWDENIVDASDVVTPGFVDVGHNETDSSSNPVGDFNQANNLFTAYGPLGTNRVFDTWYTDYDHPANGAGVDEPPFLLGASGNTNTLNAIQITIRFYDVSSGQIRQTTIREAMTYDN